MPRFKMPVAPTQMWLLPPSLDDMLPKDVIVRVLSDVMNELDWSKMEEGYSNGAGRPAYWPRVMTKILVYAYSNGIMSSRKIEELVEYDLRYVWLAGGLKPDFHTIARFRKDKWDELALLFADSSRVCKDMGLVLLHEVSIDGTKLEANAGHKTVYDRKRLEREIEEMKILLRDAEEADRAEDALYGDGNGRELPEELVDAKKRKAKLEKLSEKLSKSGEKFISAADEESTMVKTKAGVAPGFNVQAAVDSANQIILAAKVIAIPHDHGQLPEMLDEVKKNTGLSPCVVLADNGYCDEATLKALDERGQAALLPVKEQPQKRKNNGLFSSKCFLPDGQRDVLICPAGRELAFKQEVQTGSGVYRVYAARGCGSCSFQEECVGCGKSRRIQISSIEPLRQSRLVRPMQAKRYTLCAGRPLNRCLAR